MNKKTLSSILFITIIFSIFSPLVIIQPVNAATTGSLAENLNTIINNVNWNLGNSWTANWAVILANKDTTAFDIAITADINRGDYLDALYVARLAELNGYSSQTIIDATRITLDQVQMCGSLPITANAKSYGDPDLINNGCFLVYHRYALWGNQYASTYGLDYKWNKNQAFADFASAYDRRPSGSVSGEMLWCDPQESWARSYSSRYYDEHAQTLSTFLKFAEMGVPGAMDYADRAWTGVQAHWNTLSQYYGYTGTTQVECEMGNFAQIIAQYKDLKSGAIPYWDRVIQDLNYKLLANSWSSPGWAGPGVIIHAKNLNNQLRLWETMGSAIALQTQYPYFTSTMKANWANMLMGTNPAWLGLMNSGLKSGGYFSGVSGTATSNEATACAAATLFLYGIVPEGGNLDIPNIEEFCNDLRTPFKISDFKFDYSNRQITIPVNAGKITFIYGTNPVSYTFTNDGVYKVKFSNDWNLIIAVNDTPVVTNPPSAPTNLQATAGNSKVTLSWTAPADNGGAPITGYKLYKGTMPESLTEVIALGNVGSYVDLSVTNGVTYYYCIAATNAAGDSATSNQANVTPNAPITKTMTAKVTTDKTTYSRGATVKITVTVKETSTQAPVNSATASVAIYGANGKLVWSNTGVTDQKGFSMLSYKLPITAQRGTYTIKVTVTCTGFETATAQTTFKV